MSTLRSEVGAERRRCCFGSWIGCIPLRHEVVMEVESGLGNASSGRRLRGDRECTAALTRRNPTFAAEQPSGSWLVHNGYTPEPEATDDRQRRPEHEGQ